MLLAQLQACFLHDWGCLTFFHPVSDLSCRCPRMFIHWIPMSLCLYPGASSKFVRVSMKQSLKHLLCHSLILILSQPNNTFAASNFRDTLADSAEDQVLHYIFLLPHRSKLCVLSASTILYNHHQVHLGFQRLLPSGLFFKSACLLLTSGSSMVLFPILSDESYVLTAWLYNTSIFISISYRSLSVMSSRAFLLRDLTSNGINI